MKLQRFPSQRESAENQVELSIILEESRRKIEKGDVKFLRAYLVNLELPDEDPHEVRESLRELGALVRTLGDDCVGVTLQKKEKPVPATLIGEGKVLSIKKSCQELKVDYVAFDSELSPSQVRNLEKILGIPVIDRTGIILQIFQRNAKTKEAKTQIEIARLEYLYTRISNSWIAWERQRGGGSVQRGLGETFLEMEKRRFRDKISLLKKELEKVRTTQSVKRTGRHDALNVVLVGYTNAGKTTLMNGLTDSELSAKDSLFETLDSSVRKLKGTEGLNILVTDTVGFIRNLPHSLVSSFRSTLEEVLHADLLVHVVDVSQPYFKDHIKTTEQVLFEIGVRDTPVLYIFNKLDRLSHEVNLHRVLKRSYPHSLCISGQSEKDLERLKESILKFFLKDLIEIQCNVSVKNSELLSFIYTHTKILESQWNEDEAFFKLRMRRTTYDNLFLPNRSDLGDQFQEIIEHELKPIHKHFL